MKRLYLTAAAGALAFAGYALAGPERVAFPNGYQQKFTRYLEVDRPDRKIVRFMYVNPEANLAAKSAADIPDGTILIMEDHPAEVDASGTPRLTADGRLIAADKVSAVFLMEKRKGWGDAFPADKRNGDWDYAVFNTDGTRRGDVKYEGCFSCHQSRDRRDFTFTYWKSVADGANK